MTGCGRADALRDEGSSCQMERIAKSGDKGEKNRRSHKMYPTKKRDPYVINIRPPNVL